MSTLPGLASKGEKGKSKYQSLDINNLWKAHTGEPLETQHQKSTLPRKHGMQSLGKVPTARRPPANLPSLKSEHTGSDAAVSLVPSGGTGWGKQEGSPSSTTSQTTPVTNSSTVNSSPNISSNPVPVSNPTTVVSPAPAPAGPPPLQISKQTTPTATPVSSDKSWSSVMSGNDIIHPPPYHSAQFQHEFPSLSAGDGVPNRPGTDMQYGPGPSLRPQNEGSWIGGGSRPPQQPPSSGEIHSRNNASGHPAASPQLSGPAGPQVPIPPQFRGVIPPFMCRGNFATNGHGVPNFSNSPMNGPKWNAGGPNRGGLEGKQPPLRPDEDDVVARPIIKEEDLSRMEDLARDVGWASYDDIDYNQKLAFSDDESSSKDDRKENSKTDHNSEERKSARHMGSNGGPKIRHLNEDEEVWKQRRMQQTEKVALAVERAKQRKEEEEKRFLEQKQAAAKKLQMLEEKMSKSKRDRDLEETQGTISPLVVPPQPITPAPIPVPEWEKDKDQVQPNSNGNVKIVTKETVSSASDFHKLTQIEGRPFVRKDSHSVERETMREQTGPNFSKQFQSNLPPRFKKQQQQLRSIVSSPQLQSTGSGNNHQEVSFGGWQPSQQFKSGSTRHDSDEPEVHESAPYSAYDSDKSVPKYNEDTENNREKVWEETNSTGWEKEKDHVGGEKDKIDRVQIKKNSNQDIFEDIRGHHSDEWRDKYTDKDDRYGDKHERPQRPDSRDSRASRESRHSRESNRDYDYYTTSSSSWADSPFDPSFDKKKKDSVYNREERLRVVPGPITKERIEAEDYKNEKVLTQLKRGLIIEKPSDKEKTQKEEDKNSKSWGEVNETKPEVKTGNKEPESEKDKHLQEVNSEPEIKQQKLNMDKDNKEDKQMQGANRKRQDSRPWASSGAFIYRNSWKRNESRRGSGNSRFGGPKKPISSKTSSDWPHTESEASADEVSSESLRDDKKSPKMPRKSSSKDDKNKENKVEKDSSRKESYTPRGEPSRHGRGSSHFRSGSGRGGITKRIDGYGPPPSKSPFSHIDEKDGGKKSENVSETDDKGSQNSAGVIGSNRNKDSGKMRGEERTEDKGRRNKGRKTKDGFGGSEENYETSDNSEENGKDKGKYQSKNMSNRNSSQRRNNSGRDYRSNGKVDRKDEKIQDGSNIDQSLKGEKDTDGFQEVKSKKNVQRQKPGEDKLPAKPGAKFDDRRSDKTMKKPNISTPLSTPMQQQQQQQVASIPSLMDTPVNPPPPMLAHLHNKDKFDSKFDRNRQTYLAPRFAKQRENNRLQKNQIHHQQDICDKMNHGLKIDAGSALPIAWNKLSDPLNDCSTKNVDQSQTQQPSPNQTDKISVQNNHLSEKPVLDGSTPPVNTIIFENTNFKSAPGPRRNEKPCKIEEGVVIDSSSVISNFNKPIRDLLCSKNDKTAQQVDAASIQMQLSFTKEDSSDMKLDFFESEITHLTEEKSNSKNLGLQRSIHTMTSSNNTISTADALNFKIASVKKVWESMPTVVEQGIVVAPQDDSNAAATFSTPFGPDAAALEGSTAFVNKGPEEEAHERYNASPSQTVSNNSTTNVCKVKPTQQIAGSSNQAIHATGPHQPHSGVVGPGIVGHPLSPPPMQPVIGTGVGLGQPPQPYTSNQHLGYQPSVGGGNQFGMSAIPSPPTVLFNSTQQLQAAAAAQSGLYGTFQIDQSQVLGTQGRSQFSQYPYGLGQTASSPYSAQSMYLQSAQPHPPPTAQPPPPPELYTNMNSYRLSATGPFAQNQQLNNPTTVLISSTSNSLMSATVKPSTQPISAIGTKAGGAGQAYQPTSQQGQQLYMTYDMQAASYLPNTGVLQRGPSGPLQNNVVTALQPSASSFYTGTTGGQTAGYFQQQASSALQSTQLQQHQASYGMQGNIFGNPNQSHTSAGLQNFSSHFLSSPMQLAAAAALNAQQYRSQNMPNTTPYMKSMGGQHVSDQSGRQLKSPASQQDILSSVFNSGPQIPSPKSKQNAKQPVPQTSPTAQHKYNLYQSVNSQQMAQMQRYPTPIQRPMNYQSSVQNNSNGPNNSSKHKNTNQNQKMRHYYGSQGSNLGNSQHDKMDEKLTETSGSGANASIGGKSSNGAGTGGGVGVTDVAKDHTVKTEETVVKE